MLKWVCLGAEVGAEMRVFCVLKLGFKSVRLGAEMGVETCELSA